MAHNAAGLYEQHRRCPIHHQLHFTCLTTRQIYAAKSIMIMSITKVNTFCRPSPMSLKRLILHISILISRYYTTCGGLSIFAAHYFKPLHTGLFSINFMKATSINDVCKRFWSTNNRFPVSILSIIVEQAINEKVTEPNAGDLKYERYKPYVRLLILLGCDFFPRTNEKLRQYFFKQIASTFEKKDVLWFYLFVTVSKASTRSST